MTPEQPRGFDSLMPVIAVVGAEWDEGVGPELDQYLALRDDAYWHRFVRLPFTWQRFATWWVARRWVVPRDIRKR